MKVSRHHPLDRIGKVDGREATGVPKCLMPPPRLKITAIWDSAALLQPTRQEKVMNIRDSGATPVRRRLPLESNLAPRQLTRFPRDIRLRDGYEVRLHELRSRQRELLKAFFAGCSPQAIRYRFMSSIKGPSDSLLDYLADADGSYHVALIVTQGQGDDEKIVAESRYVIFKDRPYAADIAFLVLDEVQRRGIATLMLHELMEIARNRGVTRFSADVLADNRPMLSLLRKIGHPLSATVSQGVIHFEFPIACREDRVSAEAA